MATQAGRLSGQSKFCGGCAATLHMSAPLCPQCGAVQRDIHVRGEKSRLAAALLALFLGGFGIHKFYLGRIGWGIVYLLFCWTFVPAFVSFIEFIVYLCMTDEQFAAKYG